MFKITLELDPQRSIGDKTIVIIKANILVIKA
jgi:hypothetical protein